MLRGVGRGSTGRISRMWRRRGLTLLGTIAVAAGAFGALGTPASTSASGVPAYDHVFVIVEENHGFSDVIGNAAAPNLNALASRFGVATDYFGVTHPSEPNYVALLGGDSYGISSDDAYYTQSLAHPSL